MRMYNIKHRFGTSEFGITVPEWLKLPESQRRVKLDVSKPSAERAANLAAEFEGMQAHLAVASDRPSTSTSARPAEAGGDPCYSDE